MTIQGIDGSSSTYGANAANAPNAANASARTDAFLNALRSTRPDLADALTTQVDDLRANGATPQQVAQSVRQQIESLSPSDRADVAKAFSAIQGGHHHRHHHAKSSTSTSTTPDTSAGLLGEAGTVLDVQA